ncbi:poly alpha-glucosyltransferase, partial [Acinetobacter oleivorans]|nr:poly alpha-glucosyltransferase [Acinetobacter oleivorans]
SHIKEIINKNASFLTSQILEDGKFIYGYFPAFNNEIKSYNTIRHCTSIYSLLETFEIEENNQYWSKIHLAIEYSIKNFYKLIDEDTAHMIDGNDNNYEIKLGANAATILMLTKYQEITKNKKYLEYAEKIANGILQMIDKTGKTTH